MVKEEGKIKLVDEEERVVILEEHDGSSTKYEIVEVLDIKEQTYIVLMEEGEEAGEGYALKVSKDETGERVYFPVVDEQELLELQQELA